MALTVWTKTSGYNFGDVPESLKQVQSGQFIVGKSYIIRSVGTTNFTEIGSSKNTRGTIFVATNSGNLAGPGDTPGTGVASEVIAVGEFIVGYKYAIEFVGVTDFTTLGALSNTIGEVFTASGTGERKGSDTGYASVNSIPFTERQVVNIPLPVENDNDVSYAVISGKLPPGLIISGNYIVGTIYDVPRLTEFTFCIRAKSSTEFADRTFKISVSNTNGPEFITPSGALPMGTNEQYFVLDSTLVDYQIEAFNFNTSVDQRLTFFIADGEGQLPPGLTLTEDGRLVGFVEPIYSLKPEDGNGFYDVGVYDSVGYDWGIKPSNGYDSYLYDNTLYDFSAETTLTKKVNRNYEFIVSLSDGNVIEKRLYKIFVVADDYFRADNDVWLNGSGLFTADVTYMRSPIWLTRSDLGTYRANNYITFKLDTYDVNNVIYNLELVNADNVVISYQKTLNDNVEGSTTLTILKPDILPKVGQYLTFDRLFNGGSTQIYYISGVTNVVASGRKVVRLTLSQPLDTNVPNDIRFFIGAKSEIPPGLGFDITTGEVFGFAPYQPAITKTYKFTVTATRIGYKGENAYSWRTFTVKIIGEIDSVITWITDPDLGTINANFISTLSVVAITTMVNSVLLYQITEGRLPPGLTLGLDGEIVGKVNQYGNPVTGLAGLTTFNFNQDPITGYPTPSGEPTTFDNSTTTVDRVYKFIIEARDQYGLAAISREFTISVETPNELVFSNLRVKPYLKLDQRALWKDFINDTSVFTPGSIYRPNDPNFGIQTDLSMIIYAGIETKNAAAYISAIGLNHKRKRFHFGSIKKGIANIPGTYNRVYEVVYVEMYDPFEPNSASLANVLNKNSLNPNTITVDKSNIFWQSGYNHDDPLAPEYYDRLDIGAPDSTRPEPIMTVDSQGYLVSDPNYRTYFPNGTHNWRSRIKSVGASERNYLPLWMRSIQPGSKQELDFVLAVPICYCKVGTADDIILNIKYSSFDFKLLDYTVDRYIIDAVEGSTADKYLVFRNDHITV